MREGQDPARPSIPTSCASSVHARDSVRRLASPSVTAAITLDRALTAQIKLDRAQEHIAEVGELVTPGSPPTRSPSSRSPTAAQAAPSCRVKLCDGLPDQLAHVIGDAVHTPHAAIAWNRSSGVGRSPTWPQDVTELRERLHDLTENTERGHPSPHVAARAWKRRSRIGSSHERRPHRNRSGQVQGHL